MLAEIPFRLVGDGDPLILVPAGVNERGPFEFILHPGAGMSSLAPRLADDLGILSVATREAGAVAGRVTVAIGRVQSLSMGAARRGPMPVGVTAEVDRMGAAVGQRIDGEIGHDFLRSFRLTLDYQRRVARLTQEGLVPGGGEGAGHGGVPFSVAGPVRPLALVPVFVNGRGPHAFALDPGAAATVLTPELAASLELETTTAEPMAGGGGMLQATLGRVRSLAVGGAELRDVRVRVADVVGDTGQLVGGPLEGVLGYSFLRHFRVTLDYPNGLLWLMRGA